MRLQKTEIKLFPFEELSEAAKEKALDQMWDISVDYGWWESVYEDAERIGVKITSFDIDRGSYCKGSFSWSAEDVAKEIIKEHGEICDTFKLAASFLQDLVKAEAEAEKDSEGNLVYLYELERAEDEIKDVFEKAIFEEYLSILTKEYEYLTSKEAVKETIEANEYEFSISGAFSNYPAEDYEISED